MWKETDKDDLACASNPGIWVSMMCNRELLKGAQKNCMVTPQSIQPPKEKKNIWGPYHYR
jgi:hypothetical protein